MFDIKGFFQSNLEVLEKTVTLMTENLSGKNVLDMYGGCGTFSVFLADKFEKRKISFFSAKADNQVAGHRTGGRRLQIAEIHWTGKGYYSSGDTAVLLQTA